MRVQNWPARSAVTVLACSAVAVAAYQAYYTFAATSTATGYTLAYDAMMTAAGVTAAALGLFILWAAPVSRSALLLSFYLAAVALLAADGARFRLLNHALAALGAAPAAQRTASALLLAATLATCLAAGLHWTQLFPRRLDRHDIDAHTHSALARGVQIRTAGARAAWIGIGLGGFVVCTVSAWLLRPWPTVQLLIIFTLPIMVMVIGTLNLLTNYRAGTPAERYRIFWVLEAGIVAVTCALLALILEVAVHLLHAASPVALWLHAIMLPLTFLSVVVLLAVAVLYAGALDSRLVIRKTMLYGAVGLTLTALFVGIESLASELLTERLGLPQRAGSWIGGIAVALVFGPIRERVEHRLARAMGRSAVHAVAAGAPSVSS